MEEIKGILTTQKIFLLHKRYLTAFATNMRVYVSEKNLE